MANTNCAASVMAALLNDGGTIVSEAEANAGAADPKDKNVYICIDMGPSGIVCIKRPLQGKPMTIKI